MNNCEFIGRLGQDAELKVLASGASVLNFSIACDEKFKNKDSGAWEKKTEWVRCTAWKKEGVATYMNKGTMVYVRGKMQTRSWDKDGVRQYATDIRVFEIELLGSKPQGPLAAPTQQAPAQDNAGADFPSETGGIDQPPF